MRGCRKLPGDTAVHLGKSERRHGPKHSPQEEGMRQKAEHEWDEATPGQTVRLAIPRGGGHGAGLELRGAVQARHGLELQLALGGDPTVSQVPHQAGGTDSSCDPQGSPGGEDVRHSSPMTHTHAAGREAEWLACPRTPPVWKAQSQDGSPGWPGALQQKLQGRKGSRKRRKESPWSGY